MRILVTGGAGFIGKHLLEWLLAAGHAVHVIDDFSTGRPSHVPGAVAVTNADLTTLSAPDLAGYLKANAIEAVVHLAAMHFIPDCMARPERTFAVNTRVTHTLVEALEAHPVERMVMASTMDVYSNEDRPHDEADATHPSNVYGLSKLLSEQILSYAVTREVCRTGVAFRFANVYGPDETNPHLIPDVLGRLAKPEGPELVMGYLGASRDFVFVKDVARALGMAVTGTGKPLAPGMHIFNLGTGEGIPVRTVIQTLQRLHGDTRPMRENPAAFRRFDRASLTPRVAKVAETLGWQAAMTLEDGLAETVRITRGAMKQEAA